VGKRGIGQGVTGGVRGLVVKQRGCGREQISGALGMADCVLSMSAQKEYAAAKVILVGVRQGLVEQPLCACCVASSWSVFAKASSSNRSARVASPASHAASAAVNRRRAASCERAESPAACSAAQAEAVNPARCDASAAIMSSAAAIFSSGPSAAAARCRAQLGAPSGSPAATARCAAARSAAEAP
jgi:hypothetical protein